MELIIIDEKGWSKVVDVRKAITRIGSASSNDIQLESQQVSPVHLQIIYSPEYPSSCKCTNLSAEVSIHTALDDFVLPTYQTIDLRDGFEISIGGFRLIPKLPLTAGYMQTSNKIEATLSFADPVLRPGYPSIGQLTITNKGELEDCQFDVSLRGLAEDCWQVDPIPLMYPGAQESIRVELTHRGHTPQAGPHQLIFSITAPEHYPHEELVIRQDIMVMPVYQQSIKITDDVLDEASENLLMEASPGTPDAAEADLSPLPQPPRPATPGSKSIPAITPPASKDAIQAGDQVGEGASRDLSKLRVVRDQFDEFWEEER